MMSFGNTALYVNENTEFEARRQQEIYAPSDGELLVQTIYSGVNPAGLVSVVVQNDPRFKMPFATPNQDVTIQVKGVPHPITIPARIADYERAWKAFQWAVTNYGVCFQLPSVEIVQGTAEEA